MQIRKILVPTDFSETAYRALEQAVILATRFNADITVLHARLIHEDDPTELPKKLAHLKLAEDQIETEISRYMSDCTQKAGMANIRHEVIRGYSAHSAILSYLNESDFDLVVMGTHGRSNIQQLLIGSVAEKIVRYASCPVLTMARDCEPAEKFNRVLLPFDFSAHAQAALGSALSFLEKDSEIDLLYVFEKDVHPAHYAWGVASELDMLPDVAIQARAKMDQMISGLETGTHKIHKIVEHGVAHKKIAAYANKHPVDLVIMATEGLVGLDRLLLGSTTEQVVRAVSRPILTLKQKNLI